MGASIFIALANSAWFHVLISQSHFYMSIMRAVEHGRFFIHASNNGVSGVISLSDKSFNTANKTL